MAPRTIQFLLEVLVEQAAIVEAGKGVSGRIHLKFLELTVFHHDGNTKLIRRRQHVHQCGLQRNRAAHGERKLAPALERLIPELQALSFTQLSCVMVRKYRCKNWPRAGISSVSRVSARSSRNESSTGICGVMGSPGLGIGNPLNLSIPQRGIGIADESWNLRAL